MKILETNLYSVPEKFADNEMVWMQLKSPRIETFSIKFQREYDETIIDVLKQMISIIEEDRKKHG